MNYIKTFEDYTFSDFFQKNKWEVLSKENRKYLSHELWELVDLAYQPLGGHVRVNNPDSVINDPDLDFWTAVDIDKDPKSDVVIFSRKLFGNKVSGWGHDGSKEARKELMSKLTSLLNTEGFWIEVSGRPAEILRKSNCRYSNKEEVQKIFSDSEIRWRGNGLYTRILPDGIETEPEYLIGRPIL